MAYTVYKSAYLPTVAGDSGVWGGLFNTTTFPIFDSALGGYASLAVSNVNVTLNATQAGVALLRVTGTLLGNVQLTTACQGFQFIENSTSGAYNLTITNGVGSTYTLPQGVCTPVIFDSTNGARSGVGLTSAYLQSILSGVYPLLSSAPVSASILAKTAQSITVGSSSLAVNCASGMTVDVTLNASVTSVSVSNWPAAGALGVLTLNISSSGAYTMTGWPGTTRWTFGAAPTLTSSGRDTIVLASSDGGSTFRGYIAAQNMS
jgi:hypothetical protein